MDLLLSHESVSKYKSLVHGERKYFAFDELHITSLQL